MFHVVTLSLHNCFGWDQSKKVHLHCWLSSLVWTNRRERESWENEERDSGNEKRKKQWSDSDWCKHTLSWLHCCIIRLIPIGHGHRRTISSGVHVCVCVCVPRRKHLYYLYATFWWLFLVPFKSCYVSPCICVVI